MPLALKKKPELHHDDFSALIDDVQALRRDIATLARKVRPTAFGFDWSASSDIADRVSDRASHLYADAARQGVKAFRRVNRQLRDQPAVGVILAFGLGLLISRLGRSTRD